MPIKLAEEGRRKNPSNELLLAEEFRRPPLVRVRAREGEDFSFLSVWENGFVRRKRDLLTQLMVTVSLLPCLTHEKSV